MRRYNQLPFLAIYGLLAISCAWKYPAQAHEALASLRKLQAATQVGVNYQQYNGLLIDAKDKTNSADRVLPEGELKQALGRTMEAYADAGDAWSEKIKSQSLTSESERGRTLISKYSLKTTNYYGVETADTDSAIQVIWFNADLHLTQVAQLLESNK